MRKKFSTYRETVTLANCQEVFTFFAYGLTTSLKRVSYLLFYFAVARSDLRKAVLPFRIVVVVWLGTQTQSGPAQIKARAEGLFFYHPGMLCSPD